MAGVHVHVADDQRCTGCAKPRPADWCWNGDRQCPLEMPLRHESPQVLPYRRAVAEIRKLCDADIRRYDIDTQVLRILDKWEI